MYVLFKNVTEKLPFLGLAGLNFLPVGSSLHEVGEGKFGPHVTSKLIRPQLVFTWDWKGGGDRKGKNEHAFELDEMCNSIQK